MTNEPAFPVNELDQSTGDMFAQHMGLSLRDYFAAKALPSVIIMCVDDPRGGKDYPEYCAEESYKMADAMLKARKS